MSPPAGLYVQYGCGLSAPDGWLNFDSSPTLRAQRLPGFGKLFTRSPRYPRFPKGVRYGDIRKGLPVAMGSCKGVYASHVLEHLALDDLRVALANTLRILEPDGVFRLVVPDLETMAREYVDSAGEDAALKFMRDTYLGHSTRSPGAGGLMRAWLGNSTHLWMWDYKSLARELSNAGFSKVRRAGFGDASDPVFALVEDPDRWAGQLGIEAGR